MREGSRGRGSACEVAGDLALRPRFCKAEFGAAASAPRVQTGMRSAGRPRPGYTSRTSTTPGSVFTTAAKAGDTA